MREFINMRQGSEEWDAIRRGKLTGSRFAEVMSTSWLKMATLINDPPAEGFGRAKKQLEVYEQLQSAGAEMEANQLNASGLSGLVEKGVVACYDNSDNCSLSKSKALLMIDRLICEGIDHPSEMGVMIPTDAMERGTDMEPIARLEFENEKSTNVEEVGFVIDRSISDRIGISPDGLVDDRKGILEIKCPYPHTHERYLRKKTLPTVYRAQVHGAMAVTGADYAYFVSYCPGMPTLIIKIWRDGYTASLRDCLKEFHELYENEIKSYENLPRLVEVEINNNRHHE